MQLVVKMKQEAIITINIDENNRTKISYIPNGINEYTTIGILTCLVERLKEQMNKK